MGKTLSSVAFDEAVGDLSSPATRLSTNLLIEESKAWREQAEKEIESAAIEKITAAQLDYSLAKVNYLSLIEKDQEGKFDLTHGEHKKILSDCLKNEKISTLTIEQIQQRRSFYNARNIDNDQVRSSYGRPGNN